MIKKECKSSDVVKSINRYDVESLRNSINESNVNSKIFTIFEDDDIPLWTPLIKISNLKDKRKSDLRYNGKSTKKSDRDDVDLARVVVEAGANINEKDRNGNTALHYCVYYKNYELADFLIKSGVDLDIQDNNGNTPLLLASYHSDKISSKLLIDNGANKTIKNRNGESFFDFEKINSNSKLDKLNELIKEITRIKDNYDHSGYIEEDCFEFIADIMEIYTEYKKSK